MNSKIIKKWNINYLFGIIFLLSYYLFFLSLERCTLGEDICCRKFSWMKKKIIEESISCILSIILLEAIILNKISKLHIIHFAIVFILFYLYSNGIEFSDHGLYNIQYFFIIVIFFLVLIFFVNLLLSLKNKKIIILYIEIIFIFLYLSNNLINKLSDCHEWPIGLNNTSIDNDKEIYGCLIKIPKYCLYKIGKFFLDRNKYFSQDCRKNILNSRVKFLKTSKSPYINKNTLHIGFPITNKEKKLFLNKNYDYMKKYIYSNYIDMNNITLLHLFKDKKPEISVDFSKDKNGKMNIHLNFNKSLSEERKKHEELTNPYSNNIMIIYIDSVSRAYSMRQLKKTLKFFENFISFSGNSNSKYPSEKFHSFQFFKYYSHKYCTVGNYPILFYGNHRNKTNKYINLYLKRNGYVTGYTSDSCHIEFSKALHNFSYDDIYDHQYVFCDPNYYRSKPKIQCFYGKLHIEYMLEYINQFWIKYKSNRKFSLILTNFAHEGTLEKLKYIDIILYKYFTKLFNKVDFPTLVLPTKDTKPDLNSLSIFLSYLFIIFNLFQI